MKKNKGITMVALVVTIILMLILAATTITAIVDGDLFRHAGDAVNKNREKEIIESIQTAVALVKEERMGELEYNSLNYKLEGKFGEGNYELTSVEDGFLVLIEGQQIEIESNGTVRVVE